MDIVQETAIFVKQELHKAESGHDWWHIHRVWQLAKRIGADEKADMLVVELGALLHDIADAKFYDGDEELGPVKARQFLSSLGVSYEIIDQISYIIRYVSYRTSLAEKITPTKELAVIQDADRLDAIGAIGVARAFSYGGHKGREFYNPNIDPKLEMTKEEYKNNNAPTINHFYEKLLKLQDMMNTKTGRKLAHGRHKFMETFLEQFYQEWDGKK